MPWATIEVIAAGVALVAMLGALLQSVRMRRERRQTQTLLAELRAELLRKEAIEQTLRRELRRLQRSAGDFEQFVRLIARELQTPLHNAVGFTQLVAPQQDEGWTPSQREYLHYIASSVDQLFQVLSPLCQLAQIEGRPAARQPVALAEVVELARGDLSGLIARTHAELQIGTLPTVLGDPALLLELFRHLLHNAIKFQPPGQRPRIWIHARQYRNDWHVIVTDNGLGIPEEELEAVFLPLQRLFSREEFEGSGMGLAVCRKIVACHGGEIWAEPHVGGAQIHVVLPQPRIPAPTGASRRVLAAAAGPLDETA